MNHINRRKVFIITASWMLIGVFLAIYDHLTLISHISSGPDIDYDFVNGLIFHVGAGFSGGFIGSLVLIYVNEKYRSEPYYKGLIVIVFSYVLITTSITLVTSAIPATLNFSIFSDQWNSSFLEHTMTTFHVKNIIFWAIVVAITYFAIQMSNKFGPGNLRKVLTGTYNVPKTEERIFMFMDLKSSTTIAEKLGTKQYHSFLKDVFSDITNPILKSHGDIYQYVGDEIVISWSLDEKNIRNCIDCFFLITGLLREREKFYLDRYGQIPIFKAGAHCGAVMAGEIGIIKRDITYSGDILNTTARIQGMCNSLESLFLISKSFSDYLYSKEQWSIRHKGSIELRGKKDKTDLYSVEQKRK